MAEGRPGGLREEAYALSSPSLGFAALVLGASMAQTSALRIEQSTGKPRHWARTRRLELFRGGQPPWLLNNIAYSICHKYSLPLDRGIIPTQGLALAHGSIHGLLRARNLRARYFYLVLRRYVSYRFYLTYLGTLSNE